MNETCVSSDPYQPNSCKNFLNIQRPLWFQQSRLFVYSTRRVFIAVAFHLSLYLLFDIDRVN